MNNGPLENKGVRNEMNNILKNKKKNKITIIARDTRHPARYVHRAKYNTYTRFQYEITENSNKMKKNCTRVSGAIGGTTHPVVFGIGHYSNPTHDRLRHMDKKRKINKKKTFRFVRCAVHDPLTVNAHR